MSVKCLGLIDSAQSSRRSSLTRSCVEALKESGATEAESLELARKQFASIERLLDSVSDFQWLGNRAAAWQQKTRAFPYPFGAGK